MILLYNLRRSDRKGGKSADPWVGPYEVAQVLDSGLYKLTSNSASC